ncbi:MAG: (d)CMP kinase [Phycisphaerales bacterium]|nr:(d)CMP kinase [Phycisphaerales bacterium]
MSLPIIVTIDGPAGTGKSSAAAQLADRLGFDMLDTGAMYRAVALLAIENSIDPSDEARLARAMDQVSLQVDFSSRPPTIRLGTRDVHERIRDGDVTGIVSLVASHHEVRVRMVEAQRQVATQHDRLVTEGRDQGSVVFPNATVRVWLDARPEVRAHRRAEELRMRGESIDERRVLAEIVQRDASDRSRSEGPLRQPDGSHAIDTSDIAFADVVDALERLVRLELSATSMRCGCGGDA